MFPKMNGYRKNLMKLSMSFLIKVNISFHNVEMPKKGFHSICLLAILIDKVFKMGNYLKLLSSNIFEECKYIFKEKEVTRHVTEDQECFSDNSDESDEE